MIFGFSWDEDDDGNKWITISPLDDCDFLTEEITTIMLRNADKYCHLQNDREAKARFIVNAMNAYINTQQGKDDWNKVETVG